LTENDGHEIDGHENDGHEIGGQDIYRLKIDYITMQCAILFKTKHATERGNRSLLEVGHSERGKKLRYQLLHLRENSEVQLITELCRLVRD